MVKKEFLARGSSAIKQVCLPVWEAAFFTFVPGVLVGESASLSQNRRGKKRDTVVRSDEVKGRSEI